MNFWQWFKKTGEHKNYQNVKEEIKKHHDEHDKKGELLRSCTGSGFYSFVITPNSLAYTIKVKCNYCNKEWNITDASNW